jgi:hypothetical protein
VTSGLPNAARTRSRGGGFWLRRTATHRERPLALRAVGSLLPALAARGWRRGGDRRGQQALLPGPRCARVGWVRRERSCPGCDRRAPRPAGLHTRLVLASRLPIRCGHPRPVMPSGPMRARSFDVSAERCSSWPTAAPSTFRTSDCCSKHQGSHPLLQAPPRPPPLAPPPAPTPDQTHQALDIRAAKGALRQRLSCRSYQKAASHCRVLLEPCRTFGMCGSWARQWSCSWRLSARGTSRSRPRSGRPTSPSACSATARGGLTRGACARPPPRPAGAGAPSSQRVLTEAETKATMPPRSRAAGAESTRCTSPSRVCCSATGSCGARLPSMGACCYTGTGFAPSGPRSSCSRTLAMSLNRALRAPRGPWASSWCRSRR